MKSNISCCLPLSLSLSSLPYAPFTLDEDAIGVECDKEKMTKFASCCCTTAILRHLTASFAMLPPSAMNVLKFLKPSWSNDAPHSSYSLAVIVVGVLWNSC